MVEALNRTTIITISSSSLKGALLDPKKIAKAFPRDVPTFTRVEELDFLGAGVKDDYGTDMIGCDVGVGGVGVGMSTTLSSLPVVASLGWGPRALTDAEGPLSEGPSWGFFMMAIFGLP